jgi:hypothetical protein
MSGQSRFDGTEVIDRRREKPAGQPPERIRPGWRPGMRPRRWPRSVHVTRRLCRDLAPMSGSARSAPSVTRQRCPPAPCAPSAPTGRTPTCARIVETRLGSTCWRFERSSTSGRADAAPQMLLPSKCRRRPRQRQQPGGRQTAHRGQQWLRRGRPWSQLSGATVHLSSGRRGAANR